MSMRQFAPVLAATALLLAGSADASVITLDGGRPYSSSYHYGGMGSGRGVGFLANDTFDLTGVAIDLSVLDADATGYVFDVFGSTDGHSADGGLLTSTGPFTLAAGNGYQDQALAFTFVGGSYYVINFRRTDNSYLAGLGTQYSWEDPGTYVPFNYGLVTVLEGFEGYAVGSSNPLIPHMRLSYGPTVPVVPEPMSIVLLGVGFAAIGARRWRRRA